MKLTCTFKEFLDNTGYDGKANKRGPKLSLIDKIFAQYDQEFDKADRPRQIELTATLFVTCKNWLQSKADKSEYVKGFFSSKLNENLDRRRKWVSKVAMECLDALALMDAALVPRVMFDAKKVLEKLSLKDFEKLVKLHNSGLVRYLSKEQRLKFVKGKLRWIDNTSGHYKPTIDDLRNAVSMLASDGVDLSDTCAAALVKTKGVLYLHVYTAAALLAGAKDPDVGIYRPATA